MGVLKYHRLCMKVECGSHIFELFFVCNNILVVYMYTGSAFVKYFFIFYQILF